MKKIMLWITDKFAPKMNKVVENPWVAAVAGSMMKGLPFILAGSLISFYNVFRSYVSALPDLGKVADFSFGFISIFLAFRKPVYGKKEAQSLYHCCRIDFNRCICHVLYARVQ